MEIFEAITQGDQVLAESLLDANPDLVYTVSASGTRPVMQAIYYGQTQIANLLRSKMDSINLWEAAALGELNTLQDAVSEEAGGLDAVAPDGFTALGLAAFFGRLAVLEWLLAQGASPNLAANNPMAVYPIHSAVANRDPQAALTSVRLLVASGAKVNVAQRGGWTPLHQAAEHGNQPLVEFLLEVGADASAKSSDGRTPGEMAAEKSFEEVVNLLN